MNTEQKTQLKESMERIVKAMERWEKVREIAKDIIAWTMKDARRFIIEIDLAVGTKVIYGYVSGTAKYATYGEELNEMTLRQTLERFFEDYNALVNMVSKLADAASAVAEQNIEELKEQLK